MRFYSENLSSFQRLIFCKQLLTVTLFIFMLIMMCSLCAVGEEPAPQQDTIPFEVVFEGHDRVSASPLRREAANPEYEVYSIYLIDDLVKAIEDIYYSRGFPEVRVRGVDEAGQPGRVLRIQIEEGNRYRVGQVQFEGNESFSSKELSAILAQYPRVLRRPPFDRVLVRDDRRNLSDYYLARGFLEVKVSGREELHPESERANIWHAIQEGPRYSLHEIQLAGHQVYSTTELLEVTQLILDRYYSPVEAEAARARLLDHYRNTGYPFAQVNLAVEIDRSEHSVQLNFLIQEGHLVTLSQVYLEGNQRTRSRIINREVDLEEGEPYSRFRLFETRRNIFALGLFSSVNVEPSSPLIDQATTDIAIQVEEGRFGRLRLGVGYGTEENARVSVESVYANLFGLAHEVGVYSEVTGIGDAEELYYRIPRIYDSAYDFRGSVYHRLKEEPSFTIDRYGGRLELQRKLGRHDTLTLHHTLEDVRLEDVKVMPTASVLRRSEGMLSKSGVTYLRDTRDGTLNPTRGTLSKLSLDFAGSVLGGDFDFLKAEGATAWFFPAPGKSTLALSLRGGWIEPYGRSRNSPLSERFLIGGDDTLRGFPRNEISPQDEQGEFIGGDVMLLLNVEYRFPLYKSLRGAVFFDTGNVWSSWSEVDLSTTRETIGFGLRYHAPIATIRLDYGVVLDPKEDEDRGRIHFSIGHAF